MTIIKADPPRGGERVLGQVLEQLGASSALDALGGTESREVAEPLPVYILEMPDALEGRLPPGENPDAWRYLVIAGHRLSTADLDAARDDAPEPPSFNRLSEGDNVERLNAALHVVEERFEGSAETYEIRLLEVPALNTAAVWLFSPDGSVFIPFLDEVRLKGGPPAVDPLFQERLGELARTRLRDYQR